jgi:hypothetical protein
MAVMAALIISTAAYAEPQALGDKEMDQVTAGFTVNGKLIMSIDLTPVGDPTFDVTIQAGEGENAGILPAAVHDNNTALTPADPTNGGPPLGLGIWSAGFQNQSKDGVIVHF